MPRTNDGRKDSIQIGQVSEVVGNHHCFRACPIDVARRWFHGFLDSFWNWRQAKEQTGQSSQRSQYQLEDRPANTDTSVLSNDQGDSGTDGRGAIGNEVPEGEDTDAKRNAHGRRGRNTARLGREEIVPTTLVSEGKYKK